MDLDINIAEEAEKSTVLLSGEIDAYTAPQLKDALIPLTTERGKTAVVDLGNVNYMDSTGLGVFISALKSTKEHDSHLRLINIQDRVFRLFKITGLDEIIDINAAIRGEKE
jgi:anti-sigma B factor antagonist